MNKKQKIVLSVGIVVTVLMVIFPPIRDSVLVQTLQSGLTFRRTIRYRLLFALSVKDIQYLWLCVQCVVVWGVTAGLIATFRSRPKQEVTPQADEKQEHRVVQPVDKIIKKRLRGK